MSNEFGNIVTNSGNLIYYKLQMLAAVSVSVLLQKLTMTGYLKLSVLLDILAMVTVLLQLVGHAAHIESTMLTRMSYKLQFYAAIMLQFHVQV